MLKQRTINIYQMNISKIDLKKSVIATSSFKFHIASYNFSGS